MTTTKAAHTAGQWTVGHSGFERKPVVVARRAGRPATVCICDGGAREEDEANARLIAAAPELLAALNRLVDARAISSIRELVAGWNGEHLPEPHRERHPSNLGAKIPTTCGAVYALDEAMIAARAAIAKAEGRDGAE